ncbi:hypothetical protein PC129_g14045 [Phytophthora cactorum]|uniref:Uncharacterized protein n=1 Tax=Phytophthora cactorum TaxID=29920 RepID=A0A329RP57_9STRA|nr:hypothetical protein Pcac1_g21509 [Phytophthora cactorum]KAG2811580.1 hypothetical protein PC112_g15537 [Phytophthora cactorum]KAG2815291.1 hypothetical protein PC111_g13627 [Phytophthora cactorum]KAG2865990.1 hypothetical protein PC113_g3250 [Phytophthora cactorum]KAG2891106.1 hypothetical protein PC114_g17129 [Phytophthora cactorum]
MQGSSPFAVPKGGPSSASISNLLWTPPPLQLANVSKAAKLSEPKGGKRHRELNPELRSRTYYRRKEEKEMLEKKLQAMNIHLEHLRRRGEGENDEVTTRLRQNQELRDSIRGQRTIFANAQSIISEFLRAGDHSRYEPVIRLGTDPRARYNTLLSMKQQRLQEALYFLAERSRYMAMDTDFTDLQRFQSDNGDVCLARFDIKPLPKAQTVRQAFDGVLKFSYNLEISISDLIGDITIRENDDEDWDSSVAQHRLVTSISPNVKVDMNNVTFTQYWGDGSGPRTDRAVGDEVGIAVCNYVEEDELYPYHVSERVRQDITFHVMVAKYPRRRPNLSATAGVGSPSSECVSSASYETQEDIVVATRWTCLRLRKPPFPLDDDIAAHIRDGMEQVGQSMFTAIRHSVNGRLTLRKGL